MPLVITYDASGRIITGGEFKKTFNKSTFTADINANVDYTKDVRLTGLATSLQNSDNTYKKDKMYERVVYPTFTDHEPTHPLGPLKLTYSPYNSRVILDDLTVNYDVGGDAISSPTYTWRLTRRDNTSYYTYTSLVGNMYYREIKYVTEFHPATLAKHCAEQIEKLIDGIEAGAETTNRFTAYESTFYEFTQPAVNLTQNLDCFVPPRFQTGISVMLEYSQEVKDEFDESYDPKQYTIVTGAKKAGTIISPRHLIGAGHWHGRLGEKYTFMNENGETIVREIIGIQRPDGLASFSAEVRDGGKFDCVVSLVDQEIPDGFKIFQMMPPTFVEDYCPDLLLGRDGTNAEILVRPELPHIRHTTHTISKNGASEPTAPGGATFMVAGFTQQNSIEPGWFLNVNFSNYKNFYEWGHLRHLDDNNYYPEQDVVHTPWLFNDNSYLEGGDSGSPHFVPIDLGEGVDFYIVGFGYKEPGISNCASCVKYINEAMTVLSEAAGLETNYQTAYPDLSQFKKYT